MRLGSSLRFSSRKFHGGVELKSELTRCDDTVRQTDGDMETKPRHTVTDTLICLKSMVVYNLHFA